jgi:hypothetical protein
MQPSEHSAFSIRAETIPENSVVPAQGEKPKAAALIEQMQEEEQVRRLPPMLLTMLLPPP